MNRICRIRNRYDAERAAAFAIVAIAILVRLVYGFLKLDDNPADPDHYLTIASSLLAGEGFTFQGRHTAYRPPLYPIVLVPLTGFFGKGQAFHAALIVLQALLGGATAWLAISAAGTITYGGEKKAEKTGFGIRISFAPALLAGFWAAFDPLLVSQTPLVMTESLTVFLVTGAVRSIMLDRSKSAGIWFGAASLCRPSILACLGLTCVTRILAGSNDRIGRRVRDAFLMMLCGMIVLSPWAIRNRIRLGEPVLTTTHGGYTMALANNAVYYDEVVFGPTSAVWTGPRQQAWMDTIGTDTIGLTEPEADRKMRKKATEFIRSHPREFFISMIHRQLRFWAVAPAAGVYGSKVRLFCAIWTIPIWIFAAIALGNRPSWRWPMIATIAIAGGLAAVHLVYWTDIRMRAPIVPTLAILAASGARRLWLAIKS